MELSDFVGQPCRSHLAFEFFPKKNQKFDLQQVAEHLKEKGYLVDFETPVFISLLVEKTSASVFQNGKILVKDTKKKEDAVIIAKKIVEAIRGIN